MKICGIDDAGRGSMIGPLVIAGITIEKKNVRKLKTLGVRDSKKLSPKTREILYKKIIEIVDDFFVIRIPPKTIDRYVFSHNLNHLEARTMAKIIVSFLAYEQLRTNMKHIQHVSKTYKNMFLVGDVL